MATSRTPESSEERAISALRLAILLGSLSFCILQFALPIYAKELGASALDIGGIVSIFALMITIARPLVGWGIDRLGRKLFLSLALFFYALAMLIFGIAQSVPQLYLARLVQGIGSSLLWIPAYTVATELTTHDWGRSVGSVDMSSSRGGFVGTFIGFILIFEASTFAIGWQWTFDVFALAAVVGAVLIWLRVPETRLPSSVTGEGTAASNQLDRRLLYRLMMIVFLTGASSSMISPLLMIFLQDHFTTSIPALATAFIPAALVYAFLPGRLGALSDRFGRAPLMAFGLVGAALVSAAMPSAISLLFLAGLWVLEAIGLSAAQPAEAALVADLAGSNVRGRGYGLYMFASGLGLTLGPLIGGWLYDAAGHAVPFYVNGLLLVLGAILVLWLLRPQPEKPIAAPAG